ncbi:MAG: hypothetical protein AMXMBFR23_17480 [Chloroflexota bacterium]
MSHPDIAEIVDRCVEEITARRATLEECLARWPERRSELEPLLRAAVALTTLPAGTERAPAPDRRAAFMAELARTPQQQPRRRLPALRWPSLGLGAFSMRLATVAAPAAAIAAVAFLLVLARGGTPAAASATLTVFGGGVEQEVAGQWYAAEDGVTLAQGARLRTASDGRALLTFGDGSTATLSPGTEVVLAHLNLDSGRAITIEHLTGRLWNDVVSMPEAPASYVVRTRDVTVEARGTVFQTVVAGSGETAVTTVRGLVDVIAGEERVSLSTGEVALAAAQHVAEVRRAEVAATVTVNAPVVAALVAEDGAATGSRSDGVTVRQIPGIDATATETAQQFSFADAPPGIYTLWLSPENGTPAADTPAEVILHTAAGEIRLPLAAASGIASRVRVEVAVEDGRTVLRPLDTQPEMVAATPTVRVVETERSEQEAAATEERRRGNSDSARATATPTATVTATATSTPTAAAGRPGRDDDDDDERRGGGDRNGRPTATPTASATPSPTPTATPAFEIPERTRDFERALERAIDRGDAETLRALLAGAAALDGRRARDFAEVIAEVGRRGPGREAIRQALSDGSLPGVRERLDQIAGELPRAARDRLRELLQTETPRGNDGRRNSDREDEDDRRSATFPTIPPIGDLTRLGDLVGAESARSD